MNSNKVLAFIGSKWFVLLLGIAMVFLLPSTYHNLVVVYDAGQMGKYWWIPTVFIMNFLAAIMAFYKAAGMFFGKKGDDVGEW